MISETQRDQSLSFAENVTLLSLLCPAPTGHLANPRPSAVDRRGPNRVLSFGREASLANTLAFLSGISDDPSHVVAACVEELPSANGIRLLVAINKEHPESGSGILVRIKDGLEEIFSHLSRADEGVDAVLEEEVFDAIAKMCRNRIFARIASQRYASTYRRKSRAFFGSPIRQVLDALHRRWKGRRRAEVERFTRGATDLLARVEKLEICEQRDTVSTIKSILRAAHHLNESTNFDEIFSGITPRELNPSTMTGFIGRLSKLAQYRRCSLYLLQTAREFHLFKDVEVVTVALDAQLFSRSLVVPGGDCLTSCLSRCQAAAPNVFRSSKLKAKLRTDEPSFRSVVKDILGESRVHAEVQIACYYELHPVAKNPRVICSSKDACYLCNLFFRLYGKFHIPRTHGNLYRGWRLLPIPALDRVQTQLNRSLETQIGEILQGPMTSRGRGLLLSRNDNESTVFPFSTSLPSLANSALLAGPAVRRETQETQETNEAEPHLKPEERPRISQSSVGQLATTGDSRLGFPELAVLAVDASTAAGALSPTELPHSRSPGSSEEAHDFEISDDPARQVHNPTDGPHAPEPSSPECPAPSNGDRTPEPELAPATEPYQHSSLDAPQLLARGQIVPLRLDIIDQVPSFTAGPLTIRPEFIRTLGISRSVEVRIQWLPAERAAAFHVARPRGFIRLESLQKGVDVDSGSSECVYLAYGRDVVMIDVIRV